MVKIHIGMSDCETNEVFEDIVERVGLSRFDGNGEPQDLDSLSFDAKVVKGHPEGSITLYQSEMDESTFKDILEKLEVHESVSQITVKFANPELK